MQDFQDNEKKTIKNYHQLAILDFISAKFVMGYPCVSPYILFHMLGSALFLSYINITKLIKFKMATKRPF